MSDAAATKKTPVNEPLKGGVVPYVMLDGVADAIEFYKRAFGAKELNRMPEPGGKRLMHAELTIEGRPLFLADDFPEYCGGQSHTPSALGGTPVTLHRYVADCDAAISRALPGGMGKLEELAAEASRSGFYKLIGKIFTSNVPSIELVKRCGYREVGVHHRHGALDGAWKDVLVVELSLSQSPDA